MPDAREGDREWTMARKSKRTGGFFYRNGLILVFGALALASLLGQALTGLSTENHELRIHGEAVLSLGEFLASGRFLSALFENWESEFLQMGLFVLMTVWLRQQGASESRPLAPSEEDPEPRVPKAEQPWPMRVGGAWQKLYEHSLSLALLLLFVLSFLAHWYHSWRLHADEQRRHGEAVTSLLAHLHDAGFWFESFQNWQSEFLSVAVLCLLSIWLREKDSPQSKKMRARHADTGA
jgi:hypothetical protein